MYRGNGTNSQLPIFVDENGFQYSASAPNQLQLFGSFPLGSTADPVNHFVNEQAPPLIRHNKRGREAEGVSRQQKLQISLNHNLVHDDTERPANVPVQNPVSTGLKLSYDDEEPNSSVTSASGSMNASASVIMSLGDNIKTEMDRQKKEFDQYLKTQTRICPTELTASFTSQLGNIDSQDTPCTKVSENFAELCTTIVKDLGNIYKIYFLQSRNHTPNLLTCQSCSLPRAHIFILSRSITCFALDKICTFLHLFCMAFLTPSTWFHTYGPVNFGAQHRRNLG